MYLAKQKYLLYSGKLHQSVIPWAFPNMVLHTRNTVLDQNNISNINSFFIADPFRVAISVLYWLHVHIKQMPRALVKQARTDAGMKSESVPELSRKMNFPFI